MTSDQMEETQGTLKQILYSDGGDGVLKRHGFFFFFLRIPSLMEETQFLLLGVQAPHFLGISRLIG